jgi:hypothetical protein
MNGIPPGTLPCPSSAHLNRRGFHTVTEERLQDLIRYRIERARETFEEALLMQREENGRLYNRWFDARQKGGITRRCNYESNF